MSAVFIYYNEKSIIKIDLFFLSNYTLLYLLTQHKY